MLKLKQETSILYSNMPTKVSILFSFFKKKSEKAFVSGGFRVDFKTKPLKDLNFLPRHFNNFLRSISYTTRQFTPWRGQWPSIPFRITVLFTRFRIPAGPRWFISWDLPWISWWFRNRSHSHHLTQCNLRGSLSLRTGGKKTKWTNHSLDSWQR